MSGVATAVTAVAALAAVGTSLYSAEQQKKASEAALGQQKEAQASAEQAAAAQAQSSEEAINATTQKSADVSAIYGRAAEPGAAATMLTGPAGVSQEDLQLGKKTLLGA